MPSNVALLYELLFTAERTKDGDNIVFLPNQNRRRYAESVFGKNPPKIEKLTLKVKLISLRTFVDGL